jgi:hypothetical protein
MGQKHTESLCHSCDINCSLPLTDDEKDRLDTAVTDDAHQPNEHASCRMALLTSDWRRIIMAGINSRSLREREFAVWCTQVKGEYCAWGLGWAK